MADVPDKKKELGLRGDVRFKWLKGVGQFQEPSTPVAPLNPDGTTIEVHMFLDPAKIGEVSKLAPEKNDDNNQEEIKKGKAQPIKWYVKVPGGGGDQHHDDYSYHSYPTDGHGGSSGGSSSPPYSSVPSEDTSGGGYPIPPGTLPDPNGNIFASAGEVAPTSTTAMLTQQVQFGAAPAASPALAQRANVFPYRANLIPMAMRTFNKIKGITDVEVVLLAKASDAIPGGQSIEMNVTLIPMTGLHAPSDVYRKGFIVDDTWPGGVSADWKRQVIRFGGFDAGQEFPITFHIARRSDATPNYSGAEVWVMSTNLRGVR